MLSLLDAARVKDVVALEHPDLLAVPSEVELQVAVVAAGPVVDDTLAVQVE